MKKNQIGSSDIYISQLTLGCMSLGKDTAKAKSMIDMALEHGINHLDTADLYDFGDNEEIVGSAIKHRREDVVLTTKVGNHFNRETRKWYWDPSKEHIQQGVKASLKRLNTDYIDFYMLHGGTIDDPIDETIEAFEILKKEGLIRAYGISSIRPNVIREYVKRSAMDGIMMQYNLLDRRPEEEILDLLDENNISVLARGPLAKGILSNQAAKQIAAKGETGYLDYSYKELQSINDELTKLSSNKNELSFRYILKHPAVASVVFGASSIDQLKENINGDFNKELQDDTYHNLKKITKPVTYQAHR